MKTATDEINLLVQSRKENLLLTLLNIFPVICRWISVWHKYENKRPLDITQLLINYHNYRYKMPKSWANRTFESI